MDMYAILLSCAILCVNTGVLAVDNYGLLFGSLRTFQAHACDGNELRLNCTRNTIININFVRYGREDGRGDLCPGPGTYDADACRHRNALTVIEEKCRGQMLCRLLITPDTFGDDPCPGVRKYAEVAYKCRPDSFINKIVCENERMQLQCLEGQALTVYSAAFGTTKEGVLECPQQDSHATDECQASYASEILMRLCNGHRRCVVTADTATFGDRTCVGRKHLKVAYSCVHRELLKRPPAPEKPPGEETIHTTSFPGWVRPFEQPLLNSLRKPHAPQELPSTPASHTFRSEMQSDEVPLEAGRDRVLEERRLLGFMSEWMSAHNYIKGNKEKLVLYVTLTTGMGLLIFGTVLVGRCLVGRVRSRRSSRTEVIADDAFFSDSDLEHYEPPEDLPPPLVNYTASLRRQSSDAQPRAPVADGAQNNHYFS